MVCTGKSGLSRSSGTETCMIGVELQGGMFMQMGLLLTVQGGCMKVQSEVCLHYAQNKKKKTVRPAARGIIFLYPK